MEVGTVGLSELLTTGVKMEEMDEEELEELLERTCEVVSAIDQDGNGCVRSTRRTNGVWLWL